MLTPNLLAIHRDDRPARASAVLTGLPIWLIMLGNFTALAFPHRCA
jgi:hypothetical protein